MNVERRLAIGEGDVRERLRSAFKPLRMLREEEVPIEMRSDFLWVIRQLTRHGPEVGPDGTMYKTAVNHTMSRIRNITGRKIAERIYKLNRGFS